MARRTTLDPEAPTLFDDDTFNDAYKDEDVERIVDTRGESYDAARRIVGAEARTYSTPEINSPEKSEGASVELGVRAVAISNVMDAYNQLNKTMGASKARQHADNEFDKRYRYPDEVKENMGRKAASKLHDIEKDFATLVNRDDLLASGFSEQAINREERSIRNDLLNRYGPGKVYAKDRAKVVKTVSAVPNKQAKK